MKGERFAGVESGVQEALGEVFKRLRVEAPELYAPGAKRKSDFFRDIAGSRYHNQAEDVARDAGLPYDLLLNVYDKSIIEVENRPPAGELSEKFRRALARVLAVDSVVRTGSTDVPQTIVDTLAIDLEETYLVGTGYGRVTLPFSKDHIRSEILCHGLGAHMMYPNTRTVLDIGGQDTKGIQVDENGIVANFQMNDRCAAGCGRYLGYIADEMNMGLHELGPLAMKSDRPARINSTCTVFAGAELRDRLSLGEKREDILAGSAPRHHPARDLDHLAFGRGHRRVHLHRRRRQERGGGARTAQADQGELRRGHHQHQPGIDLHRRARRLRVRPPRL